MSDSNDIRISLPPGTVLHGQKGSYKVINILCFSSRSVTVSCKDEQGQGKWRLKLYNGDSSVTEEIQRVLLSNAMQGVILPYDVGEFSGLRFSVTPELKAVSISQFPVSLKVLVNKVIPQIAYVINQYHKNRILLRDICPDHILYKPEREEIAYCGFNNVAVLKGKSTITKAPGYGQHASYLAPEIEKYGYSVCSDYFSLGVTILTILKGFNPIENLTRKEFLSQLSRGMVPGIDVQHLRNTPYELYSVEDKVLYLVLGLMLPDPRSRWGYGEIRCWGNNQRIPLVQKGKRVNYQFTKPYIADGEKCWNQKQLALRVAAKKTEWTEDAVRRIAGFSREQGLKCADILDEILADSGLSPKGKIFRCIYTLDPAVNGLWWDGKSFSDTKSLVHEVKKGTFKIDDLSQLLKDRAVSFFEKCRERIGISSKIRISDIEEIESLEAVEPGKGAQRCMMVFADDPNNRFFTVEGKKYNSLSQLLWQYKDNGKKLRELSSKILLDDSFQAWLWAKGMENAGIEAGSAVRSNSAQSFYLLLSICENAENDEKVKKLARSLFLRWGDYAPIIWLCRNVKYYKVTGASHKMLHDTFADTEFEVTNSLDDLSHKANALVSDYQIFVSRTLSNPFVLENEKSEDFDYGYYPLYESGYFCCSWGGLEVCPAFLKSVGETVDAGNVNNWLKHSEDDEIQRLQNKSALLSLYNKNDASLDENTYISTCSKNLGFSVFMMVAACVLLVLTGSSLFWMGMAAFAAGAAFPVYSFMWYYKKKACAGIWMRNKQDIQSKQSSIDSSIRNIRQRSKEICTGIINGQAVKCKAADSVIIVSALSLDHLETLNLSTGQMVMSNISTYGYVMMAVMYLGNLYSSFAAASIYAVVYSLVISYILSRKFFGNTSIAWSVTTLIVTAAAIWGGTMFGDSYFVTMNWVPIGCIGVAAGMYLLFMF